MSEQIKLAIASAAFGFCLGMSVCNFIYKAYVPGVINFLLSLTNLAWVIYFIVK